MANKFKINLDINKESYLILRCKQNDDLALEVNLYQHGEKLDISNKTINIKGLKSNNTYIIQSDNISKSDNKITVSLNRDFTRVAGKTKIEITLQENGKQNTTFSFYLDVVKSVIDGAVESSNAVTIIETLDDKIVEAVQVKETTEQLIQSGGAATKGDIQAVNSQLEQSKQELTILKPKIDSLASGSPKGIFSTLIALQSDANANTKEGKKCIYVVTADGGWYYWNGTIWTKGGIYQSTGIANGTITDDKIATQTNIVIKKPVKNIYNANSVTEGFYVNNANGNLVELSGYSASDFINITPNTVYTLSLQFDSTPRALEQLAFYDENKIYINGLTMSGVIGSTQITSPLNAYYVRLSVRSNYLKYYQLEEGSVKTSLEEYKAEIKDTDLPTSIIKRIKSIPKTNIINVKQDGTGDFTNLRLALDSIIDASADNLYQINIHEGTYDIMNYFTTSEINDTGFIGLIKPNYVSLVGIGNVEKIILNGELTSDYNSTTMKRVSTLVFYGEGTIKNLTVKAKNLRYAVHDDYNFGGTTLKVENCKFYKYKSDIFSDYPQPYGGGLFSGMKRIFKNCYFFVDISSYPFSFHNSANQTNQAEIEIEDCEFEGVGTTTAICFLSMGSGTKDKIKMKGCKLNGAKILLKENITGVGCDFELTGYGNDKVPYEFIVTNGKQYVYNFVGEHMTVHNSGTSVIPKGTPVKYSLQANNSGVIPLSTTDDNSMVLGIACKDIQPKERGLIRIGGYLAIKDTTLTGLSDGNRIGVVNGVLSKVTGTDYIGVVMWGSWIKLKI